MDFDWLIALSFDDPNDLATWALERGCINDPQIQYMIKQLACGLPPLSIDHPPPLYINPRTEMEDSNVLRKVTGPDLWGSPVMHACSQTAHQFWLREPPLDILIWTNH